MASSTLNPQANPWFPVKSILPHGISHPHPSPFSTTFSFPPPFSFHEPSPGFFLQPIAIFNITTILHVPFQQPQLVITHWNGGSDKNGPKVPNFVSCHKRQKVQKYGFELAPRFLRRVVDPPSITKVWKVKGTNDDETESGCITAENVLNLADEEKTSVMIRNIPNILRREDLLGFLDIYCANYHLEYDFFYLPMDFIKHNNLGYAFVNFTTSFGASKFMSLLEGYKWSGAQCHLRVKRSNKVCQINWAKIQGKDDLVKHFQQSKFCCKENEYLPVEFSPPRNGTTCLSTPSTVGILRFNPTHGRG